MQNWILRRLGWVVAVSPPGRYTEVHTATLLEIKRAEQIADDVGLRFRVTHIDSGSSIVMQ